MPAFAPVDRPDPLSVFGAEELVTVGVGVMSVDCHAISTGIACIKGVAWTISLVVDGVVPVIVYVKVVTPLLLQVQGSSSYQSCAFSVAMVNPLKDPPPRRFMSDSKLAHKGKRSYSHT
jgi:hypothetical protein